MKRDEIIDAISKAASGKAFTEVIASVVGEFGYDALTDATLTRVAAELGIEGAEDIEEARGREWKEDLDAEADKVRREIEAGKTPDLRGTPRQIAWATRIKRLALAKEPYNAEFRRAAAKDASWWIENYRHLR